MRWCVLTIFVLIAIPSLAPAQGLLERIRRGPNSNPSNVLDKIPDDSNSNYSAGSTDGFDDEGFALLVGGLVVLSTPFWLPPLILDDEHTTTAYFSAYPYASFDSAYLNLFGDGDVPTTVRDATYGDPNFAKPWSLLMQIEDGSDFDGLNRIGTRIAFDTSTRFGLRTNWDWYQESLGNGRSDQTFMEDSELTYRFAQADWIRMYAGVGFRSMNDSQTDRWGFNFAYGTDIFPVWPLVVSTSFDLGDLGDAFEVDARASAGWAWRNGEIFLGYDFRRIGSVNLQGMLGGVRLWF
jgi:hypothetical protein